MILGVDCDEAISIYCNTDGNAKSISLSGTCGDVSALAGPLPMTEHFES